MKEKPINKLLRKLNATENCVVIYTPKGGKPTLLADTRKKDKKGEPE